MTTTEIGDKKGGQNPSGKGKAHSNVMPSAENGDLSLFDRFATFMGPFVSKAWFFIACVLLVVIWAPTFLFIGIDTWQLVINTATTIITFLLVALLQNTEKRADDAVPQKLNAMAEALSVLMRSTGEDNEDIRECEKQLRAAVGLEERESTA